MPHSNKIAQNKDAFMRILSSEERLFVLLSLIFVPFVSESLFSYSRFVSYLECIKTLNACERVISFKKA